jgi:tripartite-type tricarboxylate transporter receptor subunit TctC
LRKILGSLSLIVLVCLLGSAAVMAAGYPNKEVEIVVPWAAGGATDMVFRAISTVFPKHANGQPLIIKNIPGGGAVPGTMEFLKGRPDGYTLLGIATPIITKIHMSEVPFDTDSFAPVIMVVENPCIIMVPANSPYQNLNEFVDAAKANPGKISIGNGGAGGGTHLVALAFENHVGAEFLHVPFGGGGPSVTAAVGGHVDSINVSAPEGFTNVDAGQLRVLGVLGEERLERFPDAPTALEQGIDFSMAMWRGVAAPAGTPEDLIKTIHDIFLACIEDPEFLAQAEDMGLRVVHFNPEQFAEYIESESQAYEELCKTKGLGDRYTK